MFDDEDLFPEGNYQDYWLGSPSTNSLLTDDPASWTSIEEVIRSMRQGETDTWTPDRDLVVAAMKHDTDRGGGLQGDTTALQRVRAELLRRGRVALIWERKLGKA